MLTLLLHTFGRAIDTCFARKSQLPIAASGELFLHVARLKTSVVQGVSIYKAAAHWKQCMLHSLGMLFASSTEPSRYIFPLIPRSSVLDIPGGSTSSLGGALLFWESLDTTAGSEQEQEPSAKRVRARPNVAKYINDFIAAASAHAKRRQTHPGDSSTQDHQLTSGLSSHSLR